MNNLIAHYEQAIIRNPQETTHYWQLGLLHLLEGNEAEAQSVWLSGMMAVDAAGEDEAIKKLLHLLKVEAAHQLQERRPDLTEALCQQVLEIQTDQAEVYFYLGQAAALQGRLEEAIEGWQQAIDLQPEWADPYRHQGHIWQKLEQYEHAIAAYERVLELQPDWQTHYQLGLCLAQMQRWQAAIIQLQQAIQLQPNWAGIYADLGWMWLRLGQIQTALLYFRNALQERSTFTRTYCAWINSLQHPDSNQIMNAKLLDAICKSTSSAVFTSALDQLINQRSQPVSLKEEIGQEQITPIDFYETTQSWAVIQKDIDCYISLDPISTILLTPPVALDSEIHFSFRFAREIALPGTFVAKIPQGRVWSAANQSSTVIFTADDKLLGDLSVEFPLLSPGHPDKHPSQHSALLRQLPPAEFVAGTVAVLAGLTDDMYFHWMFDVLPRIDLLQRSGINLAMIDRFLVYNHLPFQRQTLEHLGVPNSKILAVEHNLHLQATELIVPSFPGSPAWMPRWACDFLRRSFLPANLASTNLRLYISRQNAASRRLINEADILPVLDQFGFQTVTLDSLPVPEQAILLAQAEVIVSPHGSGLTNIVFCRPDTKIIELFSSAYVYPCYWLISNSMQLQYYYLLDASPTGAHLRQLLDPNARLADIWIDPKQLEQLLQLAISNQDKA